MRETVLVTGGTGFIAGWCIVQLLRRGYAVRTTVRSLAKEAAVRAAIAPAVDADDRLTVVVADLTKDSPAGIPRLGFSVVDVRDLADLHVRAMIAPEAAGQRFIAAGEFMWMEDIARTLRSRLSAQASRVPTRRLPDFIVRFLSRFLPHLRMLTPLLGRANSVSSEKARRVLGFSPRPAATTIVDCAERLIAGSITTTRAQSSSTPIRTR